MPILPHPTNYTQKTYYDCGPASIVVVLAARGVSISESLAAAEAGTTTSGTPTILDIIKVLDKHLGAGTYRAVWIGGDNATAAQVAQLRVDLVASVDAGYALVANVVGTATTADGSEVNSYQGGHYLAPTGYDSGGDRAWIVDVADGHEYWMTTKALADWIAGRGYATLAAPAARPTAGADMATIVKNVDDGKFYVLGGDGVARKLALTSANGIADVGYVASGRYDPSGKDAGPRPGRTPFTNTPIGAAPWIDIPAIPLGVLAVDAPAAGAPAQVDAAAVAKALLTDPSLATMLAEAAFQGAQRAERE